MGLGPKISSKRYISDPFEKSIPNIVTINNSPKIEQKSVNNNRKSVKITKDILFSYQEGPISISKTPNKLKQKGNHKFLHKI